MFIQLLFDGETSQSLGAYKHTYSFIPIIHHTHTYIYYIPLSSHSPPCPFGRFRSSGLEHWDWREWVVKYINIVSIYIYIYLGVLFMFKIHQLGGSEPLCRKFPSIPPVGVFGFALSLTSTINGVVSPTTTSTHNTDIKFYETFRTIWHTISMRLFAQSGIKKSKRLSTQSDIKSINPTPQHPTQDPKILKDKSPYVIKI